MKIAVLVSGGDAPGINPALFALSESAAAFGDHLIGVDGGLPGLIAGAWVPLTPAMLAAWVGMGGSRIASSRDPILSTGDGAAAARAALRAHAIDAVVLFGGDGSLRYLPPYFVEWGVPIVCIPTTIDNDIGGTERSLGFDSACQFANTTIDGIRATGSALAGRFFTVETLGGHTGMLALAIAHGAGADAVLVPEYHEADEAHIVARLKTALALKGHALLVYTEFVPDKEATLTRLAEGVGVRMRDCRLGHAQRGGTPTYSDRLLARIWAGMAYDSLRAGNPAAVTVWRDHRPQLHVGLLSDYDKPLPDHILYAQINGAAR